MEQLSVSDAIRYVLVGFVGFFCYAFLFPAETAKLIKDIGAIPLTGCAMAGGAVFFFLYDALLLPRIHCVKDLIGSPEGNYRVRLKQRFPEYKLTCDEAEYAYVVLLRNKVGWKHVPDLAVLTSGIHLLYMSAVLVGLFAAAAGLVCTTGTTWVLWPTAAVAALAGFVLDRRAERIETALLFGVDDSFIRVALEHAFPERARSRLEARYAQANVSHPPHRTQSEIAVECFRSAPLSEVAPHLRVIADRINDHRSKNNGYTPPELFVPCLELGMACACIELVIWVHGDDGVIDGVMLKKRQAKDQGWEGKLTVTGVAVRPFDTLHQAQERLLGEITYDEGLKEVLRGAFTKHAYVEVHREDTDPRVEGRRVNCLTAVYAHSVPRPAIPKLQSGFEYVPVVKIGDESIVDHHRDTLSELSPARHASGAAR